MLHRTPAMILHDYWRSSAAFRVRIALALKVARIGIDLVQKEPARRHGPKADG